MSGYQEGRRDAAEAFIDRASPVLLRFFLSRGSGRAQADDLLQETWLKVHRARHTWRPGEPVTPWLLGIARHARADAWRKAYRTSQREEALENAPEPSHKPAEDRGDVERLLKHLPESQREVLVLMKITGLSLEETARATASTVGAVKQKAHRAYETLRRILASPVKESGS